MKLRQTYTALGGHGKTTFALCQPEEHGKIVYITADPTSKRMGSVPVAVRNRIIPVDATGLCEYDKDGKLVKTNWLKEAFQLAQTPFADLYPEAGVVVWDTGTQTAKEVLRESARKNWFSDKGPSTGPKDREGKNIASMEEAQKYAQPQQGDFGMAQQSMVLVMEWFAKQDLHAIVLFQECVSEPDSKTGEGLLFGPDIGGQKGPRVIPPIFEDNLAILIEKRPGVDEYKRMLQVRPGGNRNTQFKIPLGVKSPWGQKVEIPETVEGIQDLWRMMVAIKEGKV